MKVLMQILASLLALSLLAGCGGGGGNGSGGGSGSTSMFITDDLNTNYDHVWVTIKQVTLGKVGGGSTTVFNNSAGVTVDLKTLRDNQGRRFKFIGLDDGLSGQYNSVSVVLDDDLILYPSGATTGQNRVFAGSSGGSVTLSASFAATTFGSGNDDLIIDFNLSNWTDNGTEVTGSIAFVASDPGLDDEDRHERENYPGFVSSLNGVVPNQTFTLTQGGMHFTVQCSADTEIDRSGGNGNPVLANGQHVVVRGIFDVTQDKLIAARVKITGNSEPGEHDEALGVASNINSGAGTFDLDVTEADDFLPEANPIHIVTNGSTKYRNGPGTFVTQAEFFAALTNDTTVEAEGSYDAGSNTLTATKLKIEHHGGDDGDEDNAEVTGATGSVNFGASTFTVVATDFSGLNVAPGTVINVQTNGDTTFRGLSGDTTITAQAFYDALVAIPGRLAEVEGHWDGSVLVATKVKLEDND